MTGAGRVYGEALYSLAREERLEEALLEQLRVLQESFSQEPDFLRLLANRSIPAAERCAVLDKSFNGRIHSYVLNFLKILTERGHILQFSDCYITYRDVYYAENGILPVRAVSAVALSQAQSSRLTDKLERMTEKKILLTNDVDPATLGGMRLEYSGKELDDTVSHRLEELRRLLANTVL